MIYTLLSQLENEIRKDGKSQLKHLVSVGLINVNIFTQYEMYKHYLNELEKNRKEKNCVLQSVSNTAEHFKVVERTVFRAIKFNQSAC